MGIEFMTGEHTGGRFADGEFGRHLSEFMGRMADLYDDEEAAHVRALVEESADRFCGKEGGGYDMDVTCAYPSMETCASVCFWKDLEDDGICLDLPMGEDVAAECAAAREELRANIWFAEDGWVDELEKELAS